MREISSGEYIKSDLSKNDRILFYAHMLRPEWRRRPRCIVNVALPDIAGCYDVLACSNFLQSVGLATTCDNQVVSSKQEDVT